MSFTPDNRIIPSGKLEPQQMEADAILLGAALEALQGKITTQSFLKKVRKSLPGPKATTTGSDLPSQPV